MKEYVHNNERLALMDERRRQVLEFLSRHKVAYQKDIQDLFFGGQSHRCRYALKVLEASSLVKRVRIGRAPLVVVLLGRGARAVGVGDYRGPAGSSLQSLAAKTSVYCALLLAGFSEAEVLDRGLALARLGLGPDAAKLLWWRLCAGHFASFYQFVPNRIERCISELPATDFHVVVSSDPDGAARRCLRGKARAALLQLFVSPSELRGVAGFLKDPLAWSREAAEALKKCLLREVSLVPQDEQAGIFFVQELGLPLVCGSFRCVGPVRLCLEAGRRPLIHVESEDKAWWWLRNARALCLTPNPPQILRRGTRAPVPVDASKLKP